MFHFNPLMTNYTYKNFVAKRERDIDTLKIDRLKRADNGAADTVNLYSIVIYEAVFAVAEIYGR